MDIEVISGASALTGEKGFFDGGAAAVPTKRSVEDVARTFRQFCEDFSSSLQDIKNLGNGLSLDSIEMSVELTVKGEIRLIAAASAETKGGVKLVFKQRPAA